MEEKIPAKEVTPGGIDKPTDTCYSGTYGSIEGGRHAVDWIEGRAS